MDRCIFSTDPYQSIPHAYQLNRHSRRHTDRHTHENGYTCRLPFPRNTEALPFLWKGIFPGFKFRGSHIESTQVSLWVVLTTRNGGDDEGFKWTESTGLKIFDANLNKSSKFIHKSTSPILVCILSTDCRCAFRIKASFHWWGPEWQMDVCGCVCACVCVYGREHHRKIRP